MASIGELTPVRQIIITIVLAAMAVSMSCIMAITYPSFRGDGDDLGREMAERVAREGVWSADGHLLVEPPLYIMATGLLIRLFDERYQTVLAIIQVLLHALTTVLLVIIGGKYLPSPWHFLGALFYSLNPQIAYLALTLNPVMPVLALLVIALVLLDHLDSAYGSLFAAFAGLVWSAIVLCDVRYALFPLLFGAVLVMIRRAVRRQVIVLVIFFIVGLMPWGLRNLVVHDSFLPVSSNLGLLLTAVSSDAEVVAVRQRVFTQSSEAAASEGLVFHEREQRQARAALQSMVRRPISLLKGSFQRFFDLWRFDFTGKQGVITDGLGMFSHSAGTTFAHVFWNLFYCLVQLGVAVMGVWAYNLRGLVRDIGGPYPFNYHFFSWYAVLISSFLPLDSTLKLVLFPTMALFSAISLYYLSLLNNLSGRLSQQRMTACIISLVFVPALLFHQGLLSMLEMIFLLGE